MKVQINAGALAAACGRYIVMVEKHHSEGRAASIKHSLETANIPTTAEETVTIGRWWWKQSYQKLVAGSPRVSTPAEAEDRATRVWGNLPYNQSYQRAQLFLAIAKHKNPNTLLEITDPELEGIAPYLSEFNDPNGRID